jgi:hypothetical protein
VPKTEAQRAANLRHTNRRYAEDPEYRERQKANARAQTAKRTPEEYEQLKASHNRRYAEDSEFRSERLASARRAAETLKVKRQEVIVAYGGICACCGADFYPHLTLDHIDGGGAAERKAGKRSQHLVAELWRDGFPPGYQVLCWNCNWTKGQLGRCPCPD